MIRPIALVLALAALGCGNSSPGGGSGGSGGTGGGGSSSAADLAMPADMSSAGGFCGGQTCMGGTTCCVVGGTPMCMGSCPDGGLSAQCQKPSDCPGVAQACCITVANYMPTAVMCTAGAQCVPNLTAQGAGQDRACVTSADCTDNTGTMMSSLPDCCTSTQSGQHVCFSKTLLGLSTQLQMLFTCP